MITEKKRRGRPKGSKNKKKFKILVEETPVEKVNEVVKEESEVVVSKRDSAAYKWDSMDNEGRINIIREMTEKGILVTSLKHSIEDSFRGLEEVDTKFGCIIYEIQDKISNYLRKR